MNTGRHLDLRLVQINYRSENIQAHLSRIKEIIAENREADLVVFPELILHGHPSTEQPEGFLYRRMRVQYRSVSEELYRFVREVDARVIIGELKRWGDKYHNLATYVDRDCVQSYSKTHVHWTENFTPGRRLKLFETPLGQVGINICFDAAFPEVWRTLALAGAEIIVNISAVPRDFPVEYMWCRMRGAALFNQVYVVYANRPGNLYSGFSAVFDPRGGTVVNAGRQEGVIQAVIDPHEVTRWRQEEATYKYRRPQLYREIVRHRLPRTPTDHNEKRLPQVANTDLDPALPQ